jgi:hypothetical protein
MGEVKEFGGGVDEGKAEGDEGVDRASGILKDSLSICNVNLSTKHIPVLWHLMRKHRSGKYRKVNEPGPIL